MGAQVVLHRQLIGVRVVAHGAVIFTRFMGVPVVDQTSCVAIRTATLVTGEGPLVPRVLRLQCRSTLYRTSLGAPQRLAAPRGGEGLSGGRRRGLRSSVRLGLVHESLDLVVEVMDLGLVLFVPSQVIQKLLLDFEGFPTLMAGMPLNIKVGPLVVFKGQQVVEALLADEASEYARFVGLLVVEERAGVSV